MALPPETHKRLNAIDLDPARPLILSDADEVLVHFAEPFRLFLGDHGLDLDFTSYMLAGNIRWRATGEALPVDQIPVWISRFFEQAVADCPPVDGAADALESLSSDFQVVVLSNVPAAQETARQESLKCLGMNYPVLSNSGPKGPAVEAFAARMQAPMLFIDDIGSHHQSVERHAQSVHRLHFVADQRLAKLLAPSPHAHARIDDWPTAQDYIRRHLSAATGPTRGRS